MDKTKGHKMKGEGNNKPRNKGLIQNGARHRAKEFFQTAKTTDKDQTRRHSLSEDSKQVVQYSKQKELY